MGSIRTTTMIIRRRSLWPAGRATEAVTELWTPVVELVNVGP